MADLKSTFKRAWSDHPRTRCERALHLPLFTVRFLLVAALLFVPAGALCWLLNWIHPWALNGAFVLGGVAFVVALARDTWRWIREGT
jgi:hypothetical protein